MKFKKKKKEEEGKCPHSWKEAPRDHRTGFNFCRLISFLTYTEHVALKRESRGGGMTRAGVLSSPTFTTPVNCSALSSPWGKWKMFAIATEGMQMGINKGWIKEGLPGDEQRIC